MKIAIIVLCILSILIIIGWLGLKIQPKPFPKFSGESSQLENISLPDDLPAPVERFYRQVYGDQIPVIEAQKLTRPASLVWHHKQERPQCWGLFRMWLPGPDSNQRPID